MGTGTLLSIIWLALVAGGVFPITTRSAGKIELVARSEGLALAKATIVSA
jgi:molybdopterin-binding protein